MIQKLSELEKQSEEKNSLIIAKETILVETYHHLKHFHSSPGGTSKREKLLLDFTDKVINDTERLEKETKEFLRNIEEDISKIENPLNEVKHTRDEIKTGLQKLKTLKEIVKKAKKEMTEQRIG